MATHNSLFAASDVHRHPEGLRVSVQLTSAAGLSETAAAVGFGAG